MPGWPTSGTSMQQLLAQVRTIAAVEVARLARTRHLWTTGVVASFTSSYATLTMPDGSTVASVPYLTSYTPVVGHTVQVLHTGAAYLVLGKASA